jgi:hypothetical protein
MYDEEYDDVLFKEEFEVNIDSFMVDGIEYSVSGTLRVEYYTEDVAIDYPTMTRHETEFVIRDTELDVNFTDMDNNSVNTTISMDKAITKYFDKTKVLEMLRDSIY